MQNHKDSLKPNSVLSIILNAIEIFTLPNVLTSLLKYKISHDMYIKTKVYVFLRLFAFPSSLSSLSHLLLLKLYMMTKHFFINWILQFHSFIWHTRHLLFIKSLIKFKWDRNMSAFASLSIITHRKLENEHELLSFFIQYSSQYICRHIGFFSYVKRLRQDSSERGRLESGL